MSLPPSSLIRKKTSGFGLLELLISLGVAAIIALLLSVAASSARQKTQRSRELMQLRQIGGVLHLYLAENNWRLPNQHSPIPVRTFAHYLGYVRNVKDWTNNSADPPNSIFRNGANEAAIRKFFTSAYDDRVPPDPLGSFATSEYIGRNPNSTLDPQEYADSAYVDTYPEIQRPSLKIYAIPSYFLPAWKTRFSGTTVSSPFRTVNHPADKGDFPALFADGHVEMLNPAPPGMTLSQINIRWLLPKRAP